MRAILGLATIGFLLGLGSGASFAATSSALPAPPYAADDAQTGPNPGYPALDRYGGGRHEDRQAPASQAWGGGGDAPATPSAPGRLISWAGKVETQADAGQAAPQTGGWSAMAHRWDDPAPGRRQASAPSASYQPAAYRSTPASSPSSSLWRPIPRQDVARIQPRPAPTSIYDPPAATVATQTPDPAYPPPPVRMAQTTQGQNTQDQTTQDPYAQGQYAQLQNTPGQAASGGPRFYSLHRDYGLQPDAIPLPPQFFGPTADLSTPPADPVVKRGTNAAGQARNVVVADQAAQ